MSPKPYTFRSNDRTDTPEIPMINTESHNGCPIYQTDRTRAESKAALLEGLSEREWTRLTRRFWAKVDKNGSGGCWLWTSAKGDAYGHGSFSISRAGRAYPFYAHRLSWFFAHGSFPPPPLQVLHRCDVACCLNPAHLFVGTQQDNLTDARVKRRLDESKPRTRVLSLEDRMSVYLDRTSSGVELAMAYGVTPACISLIRRGRFVRQSARVGLERVPFVHVPIRGDVGQQPFQPVPSQPEQAYGPLDGSTSAAQLIG